MVARISPTNPVQHFLRKWRVKKGLTQQQLADLLPIGKDGKPTGKDQVSRWERSERGMTMDVQVALAQALGIEAPDLFRNPDQQPLDAIARMLLQDAPELGEDEAELLLEDVKRLINDRKKLVARLRPAR